MIFVCDVCDETQENQNTAKRGIKRENPDSVLHKQSNNDQQANITLHITGHS